MDLTISLLFILSILNTVSPVKSDAGAEVEKPALWVQQTVELSNGINLAYVEQGSPSGTPVLFLHGWTDSWNSFERVLPLLPKSYHAFAPSLRGHGDSDKPAEGYSPKDFAGDIAAFMDVLELDSAVIVGFSMGAVIAQQFAIDYQQFAIDYPERVTGLLLTGTPVNLREKPGITELWELLLTLEDPIDPAFVREFNEDVPVKPVPAEFLETISQANLKVPAHVWRDAFKGVWEADLLNDFPSIRVPVLILWGDREVFSDQNDQEMVASAIPDAELKVYQGNGHALHWEDPECFADDLMKFINETAK